MFILQVLLLPKPYITLWNGTFISSERKHVNWALLGEIDNILAPSRVTDVFAYLLSRDALSSRNTMQTVNKKQVNDDFATKT